MLLWARQQPTLTLILIVNNTVKLRKLNKKLDCENKKLYEVNDDPNYDNIFKDRIRETIDNLKIEKEPRLEIVSANQKYP